jgi:hypothetical protein
MNVLINGLIFSCILFFSYLIFRNISSSSNTSIIEGLENQTAGKAASFAEEIKDLTTKKQDVLLISKYRRDYENAIINTSDLVDTLMLEQTMAIDKNKPYEYLEKLNVLYNAKQSLNETMKFVDKSK